MIKNRLAVLLAERKLRITKVAIDTGISRNSLTSISQNDSEMIRLDTINTLCKYLGITPNEFFEYIPVDTSFDLLDLHCNLKVSIMDPYEIEEFFILENLKGTVQFSLESNGLKHDFELVFSTQDNIVFPINNNLTTSINISVIFANPQDLIHYTNYYQSYFSSLFHQTNYNNLIKCLEREIISFLLEKYENKFKNDTAFDDKFITTVRNYINVNILNSFIFKPY